MKVSELSVGDYLTSIGAGYYPECPILQVKGMVGDEDYDIYISENGSEDIDIYGEKDLIGIPITPEILEKNGFKNESVIIVGTRKMIWMSEDTRTEITIWMDDTLPMEIRKNVYYEDEVSYVLPFPGTVHKLQHCLRLCGINLEITL